MKWKRNGNYISYIIYIGDRVSAGGGCEAAFTTRTRCGWAMSTRCAKKLHGKLSPNTENSCFKEPCKANNTLWKGSMVLQRKQDGNSAKDKEIHGESNVWSMAHR